MDKITSITGGEGGGGDGARILDFLTYSKCSATIFERVYSSAGLVGPVQGNIFLSWLIKSVRYKINY